MELNASGAIPDCPSDAVDNHHHNVNKDNTTMDLEKFLTIYPNISLVVNSVALFRTLPHSDPLFTQAHNESPWKDQGDLVFICAEGVTVRAHRILLNAILPVFVNDLFKIQALVTNSKEFPSPQLPIFILGIDASCVKTFFTLLNESTALMTGREILQLKKLIEVLGIREVSISVDQTFVTVTTLTSEKNGSSSNHDRQLTMISGTETSQAKKFQKKRQPIREDVRKSALAALATGETVDKICSQYNLSPKTISRWKYDCKRKSGAIKANIVTVQEYHNSEPMDISPVKSSPTETQNLATQNVVPEVAEEDDTNQ